MFNKIIENEIKKLKEIIKEDEDFLDGIQRNSNIDVVIDYNLINDVTDDELEI